MRTFPVSLMPLALVVATVATVAGCGRGSPPTGPSLGGATDAYAPNAAAAAAERPISGRCATTFDPPPFPLPAVHQQTDIGTCVVSHLGRVDYIAVQTIDFAAGTQSGERTFTAPNGDVLHAFGSGSSSPAGPGRIAFTATFVFTGGTGRFAGATGEARVSGVADLPSHSASSTFEGHLAYAASDRSDR
jgi:hypothetical protein